MIKQKLLEYKFFQRLLQIKLLLKDKIRNTALVKYISDMNALKTFERNLNNTALIYEKEILILDKLVSEENFIFDIGANRGEFTYHFARLLNENGKVFAFEPGRRAYSILSKLIAKYELSNVEINPIALSDSDGYSELVVPYHNRQASMKSNESIFGKTERIKTSAIDTFVEQNNLQKLDFIKCDTEGSELLVFKGGLKSLKKFKPIIIVEIANVHTKRFGYAGDEVRLFLEDLGYNTYSYDFGSNNLMMVNSIELQKEGHVWSEIGGDLSNNNYIFIHAENSKVVERFNN